MKTTIDIPDALAEEAKAVARRSGATRLFNFERGAGVHAAIGRGA